MNIFGVPIDNLTRGQALTRIEAFLDEPRFHRIATINPEFLLQAEKDRAFRAALRDADLRIADGFGIVLAGFFRGERIRRFPGADLMGEILRIADRRKLSLYLVIRKDGLSSYEEVRDAIMRKYPHVEIHGGDIDVASLDSPFLIHDPIALCGFGAPQQELFLSRLKGASHAPRLAMGVGGSFDYLVGSQRRAPRWLRTSGLEWLWRLVRQPARWRRIWKAVFLFPFRVIFATIQR